MAGQLFSGSMLIGMALVLAVLGVNGWGYFLAGGIFLIAMSGIVDAECECCEEEDD